MAGLGTKSHSRLAGFHHWCGFPKAGGPVADIISPRGVPASGNANDALTFTIAMSPLAGNLLTLGITVFNGAGGAASTISGVADTNGATWASVGSQQSPNVQLVEYLWKGVVSTPGATTITVTMSGTAANTLAYGTCQEYTSAYGATTTWSVDGSVVGAQGTGGTSVLFPTLTPNTSGEMAIFSLGIDGNTSAPAGYTKLNPSTATSLTYNDNVFQPQTITVPILPNAAFGNLWAGVGCLIKSSPPFEGLPDMFAGNGSAPPAVFPGSFWDTALPANAPAWASLGIMPAGNSATLVNNLVAMYTAQFGAPYVDPRTARYVLDHTGGDPGQDQTWTFNPGGRWGGAPQGTLSVLLPTPTAAVETGFVTGPQSDCEVAVWDYNGNLSTSFWATTTNPNGSGTVPAQPPSSNTGQVIAAGVGALYPGFGPSNVTALSSSTSACGAPYIAYPITLADYLYGSINHMMAMEVGNPTGIPVVPATTSDGVSSKYIGQGGIPEGTIFYLPSSVTEPNWASDGVAAANVELCHLIFLALKAYGICVIDSTAGGGVGIIIESNQPWWEYNPTEYLPNKMYQDNSAPFGQIFGTSAASAAVSAVFPHLVAVEPGALALPFVTDNNGTNSFTLKAAQAVTLVANQTSISLASACATNDVLVVTGSTTSGVGTTITAGSGTVVQVYDVTQNGTQAPECFCYVIYGVTSGLATLGISGQGANTGDVVITRWSGNGASNPIVSHALNNTGTSAITSLGTGNVDVTNTATQMVIGICHSPLGSYYNQFNYAEGTELAYGASSMTNYGGTTWTGGLYNRHILNSNGQMCVWQNCVVPTATGNVAATIHMNGQPQTLSVAALLLQT